MSSISEIIAYLLALIIAITTHEAAHGMAAYAFGDDTAKREGRLTFNPLAHIDVLGTLILPGLMVLTHAPFMFGWAKPVPVDFSRLYPKRFGLLSVACAGPAVNLFLAWFAIMVIKIGLGEATFNDQFLTAFIRINLVLAAFNLLPILPLDGGRMLAAMLPEKLAIIYAQTERYGMLIIMGLIMFPLLLNPFGIHINLFGYILYPIYDALASIVMFLAGHG